MRDLGLMGESTFSLWCGEAGLIPNGSQIDKTGWDFFVEFPFESATSHPYIHKAAYECKVQVKATDNNDRKLPIKLSNLRRLITAQMPAFFVFIEFDGEKCAQRAYIVHIDNCLISKVLKRLHEIQQLGKDYSFNKRTMTINYDDSHILNSLDGVSLKETLLRHIGCDLADYISIKKSHLESTGFEDGFAQITFTTKCEEDLKKLIDVSLGIEKEAEISSCKATNTRFGIISKAPFVDSQFGKLMMPNLAPNAEGFIRFKEDKLSPGLSFTSKLYISSFNVMVPDELKKMRIEGEFFDLIFNPYTGHADYSFSFGEGVRLEVIKFRDAIKLLDLLRSSGRRIYGELNFDGFPKLGFEVGCTEHNFNFSKELKTLECAVKLITDFKLADRVDISLNEVNRFETEICQLYDVICVTPDMIRAEFSVDGDEFDSSKNVACLFLVSAPVGSHIFVILLVIIGIVEKFDNDRYRLNANDVIIEKRIISENDAPIDNNDLVAAIEEVEEMYSRDFSVVTMFNKSFNNTL
jgi:hypothetical protein